MFGPRLGIAYRLNDATVVRGTLAILHDTMNGVTGRAQNGAIGNANWPGTRGRLINIINNDFVEANADAPFVGDPFDVLPNPSTVAAGYFDPNLRQPYSIQWNVDIQRQFGQVTNLSVAYVGSHNLRLNIGGSYNTALRPGPGPVSGRNLLPYAPVSRWERSIGQSSYNALQTKFERRMSHGFSGMLSYTWSKSIDQGISGWSQDDMSLVDPYDPNGSKSVSGYDIPHAVSIAAIYELPFGPGKQWAQSGVASHILGNWQMNVIANLRSGQPFTVDMGQDIANIGALAAANMARPDLVGNMKLDNPTPNLWFNTKAFAAPAQYTFGTAGRNIGRTDAQQNFDLSLFREDRITERLKLQFRAEAFNAFNHATFGKPQTRFTNRNVGVVSDTVGSARQMQFGLKLLF